MTLRRSYEESKDLALELLKDGEVSRSDLVDAGISGPYATLILRNLKRRGEIVSVGLRPTRRGPWRRVYRLAEENYG